MMTSVVTAMLAYVMWRVGTMPFVVRWVEPRFLLITGVILWGIFVLGMVYGHQGRGMPALITEYAGMTLLGALLLLFVSFLAMDVITGFGSLMPRWTPRLRELAFIAGSVMVIFALVQGFRAPIVRFFDVTAADLPTDLDGTRVVVMSDLHVGTLLNAKWLANRIVQVQSLNPDMVILAGDILEGHDHRDHDALLSAFKQLSPPLGVWAVLGNHEFYRGKEKAMTFLEDAGITVLRGKWTQPVPGIVVAGVDDLTVKYGRDGVTQAVRRTLAGKPPGAIIFVSHTPWGSRAASAADVDVMVSGHTHGGQIWPFGYLVKQNYPLLGGRYDVNGMTVLVCRGTGTWGPRMRLWRPGEILLVTLKAGT
ncbi:MAG: metallophosphoesterase [Thermodesulfobacteriota bacterium]|nr:metallophosphoesterase [Thermodesulfobacteriota bacterium]